MSLRVIQSDKLIPKLYLTINQDANKAVVFYRFDTDRVSMPVQGHASHGADVYNQYLPMGDLTREDFVFTLFAVKTLLAKLDPVNDRDYSFTLTGREAFLTVLLNTLERQDGEGMVFADLKMSYPAGYVKNRCLDLALTIKDEVHHLKEMIRMEPLFKEVKAKLKIDVPSFLKT